MSFFLLFPFIIFFWNDSFFSIFKTRFGLSFLIIVPIILYYVSVLCIQLPSFVIIFIFFSLNHFCLILTLVLFHFDRGTCHRLFNYFILSIFSSLSNPVSYRIIPLLQLILNFLLLCLS